MEASVLFRPLLDLLESWRGEAAYQRDRYGHEDLARVIDVMCGDLEQQLRRLPDITVTYDEAAEVSTWSRRTIPNKVSLGEIENVGTHNEGRVRLRDLKLEGWSILASLDSDSEA